MAFYLNFGFYTDTFDTYRVTTEIVNGIKKQTRSKILEAVPCRVYANQTNQPQFTDTASMNNSANMLMCELGVDIKGGDEVIVHRGANVGRHVNPDERYIAGVPNIYVEPFGGAFPDLEHIQVALVEETVID